MTISKEQTQMNRPNSLFAKLKDYSETENYPFHMPGHKRNTEMLGVSFPFNIDITEIDGFDNLHNASGILRTAAEKAEKIFHSEHSYMLINGSTCGILAAIHAVTKYNDSIILARNCHKAVYNGCLLNNLKMKFIYPEQDIKSGVSGSVTPDSVLLAIKACPNAKAVVITSPTYEGVISDIATIAKIAHSFNIPLIVDNAHGVHQSFCDFCGGEPISSGADIVISSLHKTLPSLTQTAIAHVNGGLVPHKKFENALAIFETSSPSYVLMSSIDNCFDFLMNSDEYFVKYKNNLLRFSENIRDLKHLKVLCHGNDDISDHNFYCFDYGKIVICTNGTNINGVELMNILRNKYHLELEMSYPFYAVAMTSVCDTEKGFNRLSAALLEIDEGIKSDGKSVPILKMPKPKASGLSLVEASELSIGECFCRNISNQYIYAYPPGVPIIIPGEIIDDEIMMYIDRLREYGTFVNEELYSKSKRISKFK